MAESLRAMVDAGAPIRVPIDVLTAARSSRRSLAARYPPISASRRSPSIFSFSSLTLLIAAFSLFQRAVSSPSFSRNVVATETLSKTASTATPASSICSLSGMPSFSKVLRTSGSTSSMLFSSGFFFGAE